MSAIESINHSLTDNELRYIEKSLNRKPNNVELSMIDAQWSEHCSYKSSKSLLKLLPTKGKRVLFGPGYEAGVLDVDNGQVLTMHIESHNHPSAIDPYGGAATGVGGVLRDILSIGTRPIAVLDSLRFGNLSNPNNRWLLQNVVRGIADYGNCVGIPTIGGELSFDSCFEDISFAFNSPLLADIKFKKLSIILLKKNNLFLIVNRPKKFFRKQSKIKSWGRLL